MMFSENATEGASSVALYFIARPKDEEPVNGTLAPFTVGTPGVRF